jgi:TonB family protein
MESNMTRTIAAILALTSGVVFAQAQMPAQPSSTPVLQSALLQPVAFAAAKASDHGSTNSTPLRVSTGVVAPQLIHQAELANITPSSTVLPGDHTVVIEMTVDETGKPTNLHIVKPFNAIVDQQVVASVSQFRYKPGTLNGQPTAFPIRLHYTIQNPNL